MVMFSTSNPYAGNPIFGPLAQKVISRAPATPAPAPPYAGAPNRIIPVSAPLQPIISPPVGMPVRLPVPAAPAPVVTAPGAPAAGTMATTPASLNDSQPSAPLPPGSSPGVPGPTVPPPTPGAVLSSGNNVPGSLSPSLSGTASAPSTGFGTFLESSSPIGGIPWLLLGLGAVIVVLVLARG